MKIKFIFLFLLMSTFSQASFYQGQLRYISGFEFEQRLKDIGIKFESFAQCLNFNSLSEGQEQNLGVNPPALGRPLFLSPTAGTIQVLAECFKYNLYLNSYSEENLNAFISDEFKRAIHAKFSNYSSKVSQLSLMWYQIPEQEKYLLVSDLVEKILGTDAVIEDYGLVKSAEDFRQEILHQLKAKENELNLEKVIQQLIITLTLRDEFLSY